jgi:hypothetical protein
MNTEQENTDLTSNDAKPMLYEEIKVGMNIIDQDGNKGVITEILDIYNILADLENGGKGIYCLKNKCCGDKLYFFV